MVKCCIVGSSNFECTSGYKSNKEVVSQFCVPKDPLRNKWIKAISRLDFKISKNTYVCEKHFNEHEIVRYWISGSVKNSRVTRPKVVYQWTVQDVQKWVRRHCGDDYFEEHGEKFLEHEITGRALIRLTVNHLYRMGIKDPVHGIEIYREIVKLRLKTYILEVRDLERND